MQMGLMLAALIGTVKRSAYPMLACYAKRSAHLTPSAAASRLYSGRFVVCVEFTLWSARDLCERSLSKVQTSLSVLHHLSVYNLYQIQVQAISGAFMHPVLQRF